MPSLSKSEDAVAYILRRMRADGRLAYLLGPGSQACAVLTAARAETPGVSVDEFRREFDETLRPGKAAAD